MDNWNQFEGQVIDGQFPLLEFVVGTVGSAVYRTEYQASEKPGTPPLRAAIKFVPADPAGVEGQLAQWEAASKLSHPHLLRIFAGGEHRLGYLNCAYVVMEYAEDNLGQALPEHTLNPEETREMLGPVLRTLAYLHGKGFVHGDLKSGNVMAIDDTIKLSPDSVARAGALNSLDDCRALGRLLQQCIPGLPEPFGAIAEQCLYGEAPSIAAMEGLLWKSAAVQPKASRKLAGLVVGAVVVLAGGYLWLSRESTPAAPEAALVPPVQEAAKAVPKAPPGPLKKADKPAAASREAGVVERVLPDIPQDARATINGRVLVHVRVTVEPSGAVSSAQLQPPLVSKYLSGLVVDAAKKWKFAPPAAPQDWNLRFELRRSATEVVATKVH